MRGKNLPHSHLSNLLYTGMDLTWFQEHAPRPAAPSPSQFSILLPPSNAVFPPATRKFFSDALSKCLEESPEGDCSGLESGPIGEWDVYRVTDMRKIFRFRRNFDQDISKWDLSSVTDMSYMFGSAKLFNQDISKWDVSRVGNMEAMFDGATSFSQTLCGKAWVNSNANRIDMFKGSSGSMSATVCGLCHSLTRYTL